MPDSPTRKATLRSALRQRRQSLNTSEQHTAAQALTHSVHELPGWETAQRIALYLASDGEIDTLPLVNNARQLGKQVFLPTLSDDKRLTFARWEKDAALITNRYNIPEPPADADTCPASALDIIFLPLVGWDLHGNRLGMGGGYYDRTLAGVKGPLLVGLAHARQQVEHLPQEHWDVVLDYIATDTALYQAKAGRGRTTG